MPLPGLVLDTNVVLDWLVFGEPSVTPVADAVRSRRAAWLVTDRMRVEFEQVLTRAAILRWSPDVDQVRLAWSHWARRHDEPPPAPGGLRCSDADDQVFLELALAHAATALITRDRALLRLAGPARRRGLLIATPQAWARSAAGQ